MTSQDSPKAAALRAKLDVRRPALAMAAHNPLAAKLAAEAGFDAVWASGFELSASYAVPDASILPMGTHLEMVRAIGEAQDAPVVADIDTGFGNAVNVAYAVPRYAAAGAAAVVMEDKTFPKDSSLRLGGRQDLVPLGEFQGKVEAAKAAGGVLVVARTEALIAGLGEVGLAIRGNHAIRAAVAPTRNASCRILAEGGTGGVEGDTASIAEVFALLGDACVRESDRA